MSGENRKGREEAGQAGLGDRDTLGLPRLPYFPCLRWVQDLCPSMEKCSSWFHLMLSPGHVFPWRDSVAFSEQVPRTVRDCHSFRSLSQVPSTLTACSPQDKGDGLSLLSFLPVFDPLSL